MDSDNYKNELRKIAPNLNKLDKQNLLEVPDGYFDMLGETISDRIEQQSKSSNKWLTNLNWHRIDPPLAITTILVILVWNKITYSETKTNESSFAEKRNN